MNAILISLLAALLLLLGVGQASYDDTNNGDDEIIGTPDDDDDSDDENGDGNGNDEGDADLYQEIESFIGSYMEASELYTNEGNEDVFNFHGDMPQQVIDWMIEDANTLENYEITHWEITNVESTEDGIHNVLLTKDYQFGNEEATHEFTTDYVYVVRETVDGFLIDDIIAEGGSRDDNGEDLASELETFMASYLEASVSNYNEGTDEMYNYHGDMPSEVVVWIEEYAAVNMELIESIEAEDPAALEYYDVLDWRIEDIETVEEGVHNVILTLNVQLGLGESERTFGERKLYEIRETENGFLIDNITSLGN